MTWQRRAQVCLRIRRTWGIESPSGIYFYWPEKSRLWSHTPLLTQRRYQYLVGMISQTTDAFLCRRRAIHSPLLFINMWVEIIGNHWKVRSISGITLNSWMKEVRMCTKHSSSPSAIGYYWSTSPWVIIKYAPKDVSGGVWTVGLVLFRMGSNSIFALIKQFQI